MPGDGPPAGVLGLLIVSSRGTHGHRAESRAGIQQGKHPAPAHRHDTREREMRGLTHARKTTPRHTCARTPTHALQTLPKGTGAGIEELCTFSQGPLGAVLVTVYVFLGTVRDRARDRVRFDRDR